MATIPDEEDFPYVIRVSFPYVIRAVSETLESNGSSSMGSVCASSMALQAAGVPVSAPVAGVAMGLIKEGDDYIVLTDIAGVEDHLGDMDFKVAGTEDGITALQMDIKITGVTFEILEDALEQALKGRQFILGKMAEAIDGPREKLSKHAPAIESIKIDPEKIGAVIGKGGETIRALCEEFEAEIDVEDDGTVRIYAPTGELVEACVARIDSMTKEAEVGDRYNSAKVVKTTTFGAFVELVKGTDGLLHISNIECEVDISPRVHGSALFTRGETQILSNVALGTTRMDMRLDTLGLQTTKRFFHHYNFPPFSVGEAGFMRGPKRRDIGHGALAERALLATVPDEESFPYVIRAVSETLESNGSSSMGSVCASSMAMQAAGVPVSAPVAGVAMGLIKEGDDYIVLTDIAGVEDHLGDMDFKVAGTKDGITALQMDIKITGVTFEILEDALEQALKGRQFILGKMAEAIDGPREKLSKHAPAIESIKIDPEKIGAVIGKGGETIRALCEEFEAEIDVEDDGTVRIYAPTGELVEACVARIDSMTREAEVGDRYNSAKVVKTTTFGAFVELVKGTDGLLHISNVKPGERVDSVDDVLTAGEEIDVTVVEVDKERGRIGLRLSDDPSVAGKSPEELASVGSGDGGGRRNGGDRGGVAAAATAAAVASASGAARR